MKYTREQIEACAAVMEDVRQFKTAGVIRQLLAENDALLSALEGVMYWDNGKSEWVAAQEAIDAARKKG